MYPGANNEVMCYISTGVCVRYNVVKKFNISLHFFNVWLKSPWSIDRFQISFFFL